VHLKEPTYAAGAAPSTVEPAGSGKCTEKGRLRFPMRTIVLTSESVPVHARIAT
jgi:hypothetical protein